jgi:hypothetical protein
MDALLKNPENNFPSVTTEYYQCIPTLVVMSFTTTTGEVLKYSHCEEDENGVETFYYKL